MNIYLIHNLILFLKYRRLVSLQGMEGKEDGWYTPLKKKDINNFIYKNRTGKIYD